MSASNGALAVRGPLIKSIVFAIVTLAVLLLIGVELGGGIGFTAQREYKALFRDTSGIEAGETVRIAGIQVGQVKDVEIADNNRGLITFGVNESVPVPAAVRANIRYLNLTGDRFLDLADGPGPRSPLEEGATIPEDRTEPALDLDVLLAGFQPLFQGLTPDKVNSVSTELVQVLQGQGTNVEDLLGHVASLTSTLADRDAVIGRVVGNLNTVLGTLDERGPQVDATITNLRAVVSGLTNDRERLGDSIETSTRLVEGVDTLLTRTRGPLRDLVPQIDRVSSLVNGGQADVDKSLRALPGALLRISRLGSRGSTYNLFICALRVKTTGLNGQPIYTPWVGPNEDLDRCKKGPIAPLETPEQRIAKEGR